VTLQKGELAHITQSLGGTYTVVLKATCSASTAGTSMRSVCSPHPWSAPPSWPPTSGKACTAEELEQQVWDALKQVYDPEIPVNIVDLGLVYDCKISRSTVAILTSHREDDPDRSRLRHGPHDCQDAQNRILSLEPVDEAEVELVWDPPWNQAMLSESAKLQLGLI